MDAAGGDPDAELMAALLDLGLADPMGKSCSVTAGAIAFDNTDSRGSALGQAQSRGRRSEARMSTSRRESSESSYSSRQSEFWDGGVGPIGGNVHDHEVARRVGLLKHTLSLARHRTGAPEQLVARLKGYRGEDDAKVWMELSSALSQVGRILKSSFNADVGAAYDTFASTLILPAFAKVGWDAAAGEDADCRLMRASIAPTLAKFCSEDPQVVAEAARRYATFRAAPGDEASLPADMRRAVLVIAMQGNNAAEIFQQLIKAHGVVSDGPTKVDIYAALGSAPSLALQAQALEWALTDEVSVQDTGAIPVAVAESGREGAQCVFDWTKSNLDRLIEKMGTSSLLALPHIVKASGMGFTTEEKALEVKEFWESKPEVIRTVQRSVRQVVDGIQSDAKFSAFLASSDVPTVACWAAAAEVEGGTAELDRLSDTVVARVLEGERRNQSAEAQPPTFRPSRPSGRDSNALLESGDAEDVGVAAAALVVMAAGHARSAASEGSVGEGVSMYIKALSEKVAAGIGQSKDPELDGAAQVKRTSVLEAARKSVQLITDTVFADLALEGHQGPELRKQQSAALNSVDAALATAAPASAAQMQQPMPAPAPATPPAPISKVTSDVQKPPASYGASARGVGANLALDDFFSGKMVIDTSAGLKKGAPASPSASGSLGRNSITSSAPSERRVSASSPRSAGRTRSSLGSVSDETPLSRADLYDEALPEPDLIRWPKPDTPPDGPWTCELCTKANRREWHNCRVCGRPFGHEPQEYNEVLGEKETNALHEERWTFLQESQSTSLITSATWSPDGFLVATTDKDGYLKVWDVGEENTEDWALLIVLDQPEDPFGTRPVTEDLSTVAWSSSGKFLAVGAGPRVKLWYVGAEEPEKWRLVRSLAEHGAPVTFVSWAPDSLRLVSGDESGALALWSLAEVDPNRWELLGRLEGHDGRVLSATWFKDCQTLITAGSDRRVKRWRVGGEDSGRWGFNGEILQERDGRPWLAGALDEMWVVSSGLNKHLNVWFVGGADPKKWSCIKGFHG